MINTMTAAEMAPFESARRQKVLALRKATGLEYAVSVKQGLYQLEVIDFSGKKVAVNKIGSALPFAEFNKFVEGYEHV